MENSKIGSLRREIYKINTEIVVLLKKRSTLTGKIFQLKDNQKTPRIDKKQEKEVLKDIAKKAKKHRINTSRAKSIVRLFIKESKNQNILKR